MRRALSLLFSRSSFTLTRCPQLRFRVNWHCDERYWKTPCAVIIDNSRIRRDKRSRQPRRRKPGSSPMILSGPTLSSISARYCIWNRPLSVVGSDAGSNSQRRSRTAVGRSSTASGFLSSQLDLNKQLLHSRELCRASGLVRANGRQHQRKCHPSRESERKILESQVVPPRKAYSTTRCLRRLEDKSFHLTDQFNTTVHGKNTREPQRFCRGSSNRSVYILSQSSLTVLPLAVILESFCRTSGNGRRSGRFICVDGGVPLLAKKKRK